MTRRHWLTIAAVGAVIAALLGVAVLNAMPRVYVGKIHAPPAPEPLDGIDHDGWNQLLKRYVTPDGLVDYRSWQASPESRAELDKYLAELSRGDISQRSRRDGRLAFWINAANAVAVAGVLRSFPEPLPAPPAWKFWAHDPQHDLRLIVGDSSYSLAEIQRQFSLLDAPRAYLAAPAHARHGPLLRDEAYFPDKADAQLGDTARRLFAQPWALRLDAPQKRLWLPGFIAAHQPAFGATPAAAAAALAVDFPNEASRQLALSPSTRVQYSPVDNRLNEQTPQQDP